MKKKLSPTQRLQKILEIIESVDHRCMAADGAIPPTREEMTDEEMWKIYRLAYGSGGER